MKFRVKALVAAACFLVSVSKADAVPVQYTETVTVSGALNGVSFTNQSLTLTGVGFAPYFGMVARVINVLTNVQFSFLGGTSGTFLNPTSIIQYNTGPTAYVAFADFVQKLPIVGVLDSSLVNYNLTPGVQVNGQGIAFALTIPTSAGNLRIDSALSGTFSAVEATPLPSAITMMAPVLGGIFVALRRRTRRTTENRA
jgi:hypothetical protein